jgi:hypothetical protein
LLDPSRTPTLSKIRSLRDTGAINQAERRAIYERSAGVYHIDEIAPFPDGNNITLTPFRSRYLKPQGEEIPDIGGRAQRADFDVIKKQAIELNSHLLDEPKYVDLNEVIPELQQADNIIFFMKQNINVNHYATYQELKYILSEPSILEKTRFVTGFLSP